MANWTDVLGVGDLPDPGKKCVTIHDVPLVMTQVQGQCYALKNRCPHANLPLGDGDLAGSTLTCPYHGYAYDVTTGRNVDWPYEELPCPTYPVRINAGRIEVDLPLPPDPEPPAPEPPDPEPQSPGEESCDAS